MICAHYSRKSFFCYRTQKRLRHVNRIAPLTWLIQSGLPGLRPPTRWLLKFHENVHHEQRCCLCLRLRTAYSPSCLRPCLPSSVIAVSAMTPASMCSSLLTPLSTLIEGSTTALRCGTWPPPSTATPNCTIAASLTTTCRPTAELALDA